MDAASEVTAPTPDADVTANTVVIIKVFVFVPGIDAILAYSRR